MPNSKPKPKRKAKPKRVAEFKKAQQSDDTQAEQESDDVDLNGDELAQKMQADAAGGEPDFPDLTALPKITEIPDQPGLPGVFQRRKLEMIMQGCDFSKAAADVDAKSDLFATEYEQDFRQNFKDSPFKDVPSIILRHSFDQIDMEGEAPTEEELITHLVQKGLTSLQAYDQPEYDEMPEVYQLVQWLARMMRSEQIGRVMVARLKSNGHILPHKDYGPYHDHYDRFHICLPGGDGCYFRTGREIVKMMPGEVWWFYNIDEHEVWNDTDHARTHIIVDLKLKGDKRVHRTGGESPAVH